MEPGSPEWDESVQKGREAMKKMGRTPSVEEALMMRATAIAWPEDKRVEDCGFEAHVVLAGHPKRFDILKPGMSVEDAMRAGWDA